MLQRIKTLSERERVTMASTMKDIARETGLGLATISKYFNGGTVREKNRILIENAVKKLHYVPNEVARSLKTQQTRVIGVVIPELSNAFITSIISSMEDIADKILAEGEENDYIITMGGGDVNNILEIAMTKDQR